MSLLSAPRPVNDVINWLRSPAGEDWSRSRLQLASAIANRAFAEGGQGNAVSFQSLVNRDDYGYVTGFFSIKADG